MRLSKFLDFDVQCEVLFCVELITVKHLDEARNCGGLLQAFRAVNSPFLAGRLPVFEAVSLSPYFKINLPVFENNQFLNIKVYENDMRKNSLFSVTNFLGSLEIYT